jgi:iron complex outermembrane recepter protein
MGLLSILSQYTFFIKGTERSHMNVNRKNPKPSHLSMAVLTALMLSVPGTGAAQDEQSDADQASSTQVENQGTARSLDKVVVTGSLIPRSQIETFTPVTVISAEDIQSRGFNNVSEALKAATFSTGNVQGSQTSASFTQGAETISMFGLSNSYVKYLIDGRPMANYPALYNGSNVFNNISGIPVELVQRIEILPGGQSSLYGSDAIAGVVNVILKKPSDMDGTVMSLRGGAYSDGGGSSIRGSFATSFTSADDRFQMLFGAQAEERKPIWGYQRDITSRFYGNSAVPGAGGIPVPSRDFLVYGYLDMANRGLSNFAYSFQDPANCANVDGLFNGSMQYFLRQGASFGGYCGSFETPGYRTLLNGKEGVQAYTHATFDVNDNVQLYGELLLNKEKVEYHVGSNYTWWGTGSGWGYYYDPDIDGLVNLQRAFAPEEMGGGGFRNSMSNDDSQSYALTIGARGTFGDSNWDYNVLAQRTEYELDETSWVRWADPIDDFFEQRVLGPQIGWDPYFGAYPAYRPNYAAFYTPLTPEEFNSFTGFATSKSRTYDNMVRGQVTNSSLFQLPGGEAGFALAVEAGNEGWKYDPFPGFLDGSVWGQTAVAGDGKRSRYAVTSELRMPIVRPLTLTASARYDAFRVAGETVDKPTYSLGLEYRPIETLLFRGKYGTAFKAPTLSDQFQGLSGYYSFVTDYYNCQLLGFGPDQINQCPSNFANRQFFGQQEGNPSLQPINADVWSAGFVWAPLPRLSLSADYHSWDIRDEVNTQSANTLALDEMRCRTGQPGYDINSPTCQAAINQITRNAAGNIVEIYTGKVNVSQQRVKAATASLNYGFDAGGFGSYTKNLEHMRQTYPEDPVFSLYHEPGRFTSPQAKADASMTWRKDDWSSTLYWNYIGKTPNNRAVTLNSYSDPAQGLASQNPPFITYNLSVSYRALENLQFSFMVNNILDKIPEDRTFPATSGAPYNNQQYNAYGRGFYMETRFAFGQ